MRLFEYKLNNSLKYSVCGYLKSPHNFIHQKRILNEHVLIMVTDGTVYIESNGTKFEVSKGQYLILNSNEIHRGYKPSNNNLSYFWIHFYSETQIIDNSLKETNKKGTIDEVIYLPEYGSFIPNGRINILFHQLSDISFDNSEDSVCSSMCRHSLITLLLQLYRENNSSDDISSRKCPTCIFNAMNYISQNYYLPFTVSDLAKQYGYNADYFSTLFKKSTGQSLINYINSVRIHSSKALLSNMEISVREIAYSCGYEDEKYFMRVFKNLEGITPTQYRNATSKTYINRN